MFQKKFLSDKVLESVNFISLRAQSKYWERNDRVSSHYRRRCSRIIDVQYTKGAALPLVKAGVAKSTLQYYQAL